jgi:hypothetical protein
MARMSRFSKTGPPCFPVPRTATSTMARAKSSARITWLGNSTRKRRIEIPRSKAVTEVRFLPRLHRVDVRGPEASDETRAAQGEYLMALGVSTNTVQ